MRLFLLFSVFLLGVPQMVLSQESHIITYFDPDQTKIKEEYYIKSATQLLEGPYTAYYEDGQIKEQGSYLANNPVGTWEYFYENGNMKMTGEIRDNQNYGHWQYFYENSNPSMEGALYHGIKEGIWQYYYESGSLKSRGEYQQGTPHRNLELVL